MKLLQSLYKLAKEPFVKEECPHRPLRWRMGMRWSHLPKWFKSVPCLVVGHRFCGWSDIKYANIGVERNCKVCGESDTREYHNKNRAACPPYKPARIDGLRDMSSAPKDGTHILLYGEVEADTGVVMDFETDKIPVKCFFEGYYEDNQGWYHMACLPAYPSAWMPLPSTNKG